ncbi:MAG: PD40 domain-containing protein [Chloroflexi bacterium]|nr:PD40 domain-containing protein [Chloroflexota bacterium]
MSALIEPTPTATLTPTFTFTTPTPTPTNTLTPTATPVPSAGAGWLLYHSNRPEPAANTAGAFNLYAADLSVSPPLVQRLTANTDSNVRDELPVWSPDHTRIAFTRRTGTASDVCLLTLATSAVVCTDTPAENEDYPAWADSGLYLAYVSDADGEKDIYKHALSDGGFAGSRVNLTHRAGTDGHDDYPDWHGDWIVYASTRDGNKELYVMFADADALNAGDGQQRQQLTETTDKTHKQPAWSPLGDKIAYTRDTNGLDDTYVRPMTFSDGTWTPGPASMLTGGQPGEYRFMAWQSADMSQSTLAAVRDLNGDKDIVIITTGLGGGLSDPGAPVNSSAFEDDPDW